MMDSKKFEALLPLMTTALVDKIMLDSGISEDDAMERLYVSALYATLENEETKVWQYSVPMLYELYKSEIANDKLDFPEY
jgi:hypothetical protein